MGGKCCIPQKAHTPQNPQNPQNPQSHDRSKNNPDDVNYVINNGQINLPQINLPQINLPQINLPQINNLNLPEVINWDDTIPFIPPIKYGKVIKVYDGDTLTIASKLPIPNSPLYRFNVRFDGIDTPEIKGKTSTEKDMAQIAKKVLSEMLLYKMIYLKDLKTEKYGRILAKVYYNEICINDWLIENHYAKPYDGGTKS
jgi:micrococcal nuclease